MIQTAFNNGCMYYCRAWSHFFLPNSEVYLLFNRYHYLQIQLQVNYGSCSHLVTNYWELPGVVQHIVVRIQSLNLTFV